MGSVSSLAARLADLVFVQKTYYESGKIGMTDYDKIINEMNEYFSKHGKTKPIEYAYGYFDCVAVLKMIKEGRKDD